MFQFRMRRIRRVALAPAVAAALAAMLLVGQWVAPARVVAHTASDQPILFDCVPPNVYGVDRNGYGPYTTLVFGQPQVEINPGEAVSQYIRVYRTVDNRTWQDLGWAMYPRSDGKLQYDSWWRNYWVGDFWYRDATYPYGPYEYGNVILSNQPLGATYVTLHYFVFSDGHSWATLAGNPVTC